jgi:Cu+-exporting ATPase
VTKNKQASLAVPESSEADVTLPVEGMDCGACAALLEKNLSQIPGVHKAWVSFEKKQASVDYDSRLVGPARFAKAITDAGYRVGPLTQAGN